MPLLIFPASRSDIQLTEPTFLCGETGGGDLRHSRVVTNCSGTITDNVRIITEHTPTFILTLHWGLRDFQTEQSKSGQ